MEQTVEQQIDQDYQTLCRYIHSCVLIEHTKICSKMVDLFVEKWFRRINPTELTNVLLIERKDNNLIRLLQGKINSIILS